MQLLFPVKLRIFVFILVETVLSEQRIANETNWNYNQLGPDVWWKTYPDCIGSRQSPINIKTACTIERKFEAFVFSSNFKEEMNFTLINDGHTIRATYQGSPLILRGGNLNGNFTFKNFHLHWGPNENSGSEHQVNGIKYTGESHFVFQNDQTNQLAVLAFLMRNGGNVILENTSIPSMQTNGTTNEWKKYFDLTQTLTEPNNSSTINLNFSLLILEHFTDFWRYNGSLTTPPCTENVVWTVFKDPIVILNYQFETFRDDFFFESYRGPQNLFYRQVFRSFQNETLSTIPDQNCCTNQQPSTSTPSSNSPPSAFHNFLYLQCFSFIFLFISFL